MSNRSKQLRELLREKKAQPRIQHKLAKYNDKGQLTCVLCHTVILIESEWEAHLKSEEHARTVAELKKKLEQKKMPPPPAPPSRAKGPSVPAAPVAAAAAAHPNLPPDFFSNGQSAPAVAAAAPLPAVPAGLPADFFDSGASVPLAAATASATASSSLQPPLKKAKVEVKSAAPGLALLAADDSEEEEEEEEAEEEEEEEQAATAAVQQQPLRGSGTEEDPLVETVVVPESISRFARIEREMEGLAEVKPRGPIKPPSFSSSSSSSAASDLAVPADFFDASVSEEVKAAALRPDAKKEEEKKEEEEAPRRPDVFAREMEIFEAMIKATEKLNETESKLAATKLALMRKQQEKEEEKAELSRLDELKRKAEEMKARLKKRTATQAGLDQQGSSANTAATQPSSTAAATAAPAAVPPPAFDFDDDDGSYDYLTTIDWRAKAVKS